MKITAVDMGLTSWSRIETTLVRIGTSLLATIFITAGTVKLVAPEDFEASLLRWELFPDWALTPIAIGIPICEIVLGLMCLTSKLARQATRGLLVLTVLYTLLLSCEWWRGVEVNCACFGSQFGHFPDWLLLLRNLGLLFFEACLFYLLLPQQATALETATQRRGDLP